MNVKELQFTTVRQTVCQIGTALLLVLVETIWADAESPDLVFRPADQPGFFQFDTGTLRGKLRLDGKTQGISKLVYVPAGIEVTKGGGHVGLLSPYRIFSTGTRYGHAARDWPSVPVMLPNGTVAVCFPPTDEHTLELTLVYHLTASDTIDLEIAATPQQDMPQFELFLSSYFGQDFAASVYLQPNRFAKNGKPSFVSCDHNALADGNYLMFPRDRAAVLTIFDGRWEIPPSPVQWCINRWMAAPLAIRRSQPTGITAALMAPREDCFAVSTPYNLSPPDGVAGHASLYLSLFGKDVPAGSTVRAHTRLLVGKDLTNDEVVQRYRTYLEERKRLGQK